MISDAIIEDIDESKRIAHNTAVDVAYNFYGEGKHALFLLSNNEPVVLYCRICKERLVFTDKSDEEGREFIGHCSQSCEEAGYAVKAIDVILGLEVYDPDYHKNNTGAYRGSWTDDFKNFIGSRHEDGESIG